MGKITSQIVYNISTEAAIVGAVAVAVTASGLDTYVNGALLDSLPITNQNVYSYGVVFLTVFTADLLYSLYGEYMR